MPLIKSTYTPPPFFANGYIQTIFPTKTRKVAGVHYIRERVHTPDQDFIDIDWSRRNSNKLAIILHGYEGHSYRDHIQGMVKAFNNRAWDAVAVNLKGCSGEPNRQLKTYHAGSSDDLSFVIDQILQKNSYTCITLVGFSLGGNIILKYLGEHGSQINPIIKCAVCFSVPCDLKSTTDILGKGIFNKYFLNLLYKKMKMKNSAMPGLINMNHFKKIKNLYQYDQYYTVPINNFESADAYYEKCSALNFLKSVAIPTLVVNAKNDPMLGETSYPEEAAHENKFLFLEIPKSGGHTGFISFNKKHEYWSESRATSFIEEIINK